MPEIKKDLAHADIALNINELKVLLKTSVE